jgi:phage N-6-adenine-methyltransferase
MGMFDKAKFATNSVEWATPDSVFEPLAEEFDFGLDVAASLGNRKCMNYLGPDHPLPMCRDGLTVDWANALEGTDRVCWMNPPFGRALKEWVKKAHESVVTVVALLPAKTNTNWWHDYVMKNEVRFLRGRPKFIGAKHGLPFPLAVVIFRRNSH